MEHSTVTLKPTKVKNDASQWKVVSDTPFTAETCLSLSNKSGQNAGQKHAESLIQQPSLIPKDWKGFHLVFAGTVRRRGECKGISTIHWFGPRGWHLNWSWGKLPIGSNVRYVRCA